MKLVSNVVIRPKAYPELKLVAVEDDFYAGKSGCRPCTMNGYDCNAISVIGDNLMCADGDFYFMNYDDWRNQNGNS